MKEGIYMSKKLEIFVELITEEKAEYLSFLFESPIKICLTSDDQSALKFFFSSLLQTIKNDEISFKLNDNGRRDLFYEVAQKYIINLNREIAAIQREFPPTEE